MKTDYEPSKADLTDPFLAHEALDRTHLVICMMSDHVLDHPFVHGHPAIKEKAERVVEALSDIYQSIGAWKPVAAQAKEQ